MHDQASLVVPAWLGPDKIFFWDKANAFDFGVFALDRTSFAFADSGGLRLSGAIAGAAFDWPKIFTGAAIRIKLDGVKKVVAFSRPFPESPGPDPTSAEQAVEVLEKIGELPMGEVAQGVTGILSGVVNAINSVNELKAGRVVGTRVRGILEGQMPPRR
ncbi:hypothetical protein AB0C38_13065 [Amycolatopsis sp. NPDC048633]|uniref:hypothetical protein n=1 Tax=Amycolatopsis sp. NPDC048633 TaxID=3157095 RepID=UPI0033F378ED